MKMMESTLSLQDIKALREIVPRAFSIGNEGDYIVNYVELNDVLLSQSPKGDDFNSTLDRTGTEYTAKFYILYFIFYCTVHQIIS